MQTFSKLIELITSDAITMAAATVLAIAIVGLLLVISWPSRDASETPRIPRSRTARGLAASGLPAVDIARRTGLSRDGLALLLTTPPRGARQLPPESARFSRWFGAGRRRTPRHPDPQVAA
jgi:hypothetical protein